MSHLARRLLPRSAERFPTAPGDVLLHLHRAERSDALVAALGDVLGAPLDDPLVPEVVAVHSRGIERFIAQELSLRLGVGTAGSDGVCANVEFPFPAKLIRGAVAEASDFDPDTDPWLPERSTWPLLAILEEDPGHERLGPLRAHAAPPAPGEGNARRLGAVRHVADLFDRYGVHRPEMILAWKDGRDVGPDGAELGRYHRWQPRLWRALDDRIDGPSFAERRADALMAIQRDPHVLGLPPRLALFGLTALPATYLEVLATIGGHRDVHLMLLHPSPALWDRVSAMADGERPTRWSREEDPTAAPTQNPLLRSWGRDSRELQLITPTPETSTHHRSNPDAGSATLLRWIQQDVKADRIPRSDGRSLARQDRSVQVHDCHGRLRQVTVMRDAILHLLADDPTLELRDIIVMCPDIEGFASLITAVFGADAVERDQGSEPGAPPALRVRLADRSLRRTNPVLDVISTMIELVDGRVSAPDVLDLVARPPVRRRFGFDDDDIEQLETWVGDVHVRWGFDGNHRRQQGLPELDANTWRTGLDRLLLGITMADEQERMIAGVAPYDGVEGKASGLAGRLVEFVERLRVALEELRGPHTLEGWRDTITSAADALTLTDGSAVWQRLQLNRVLADLVDESTTVGVGPVDVTLPEIQTLLAERLAGRPSTTSHRTGDLTFCTLVPMRSVPHRVVCLLGLDDGAFPRQTVPDADDLLLLAPRVGDRDPRSEDRQLLLDALLAATETLVITYAGRDVRTNEERPPAVPIDELLDVVDRTVDTQDGMPARNHVTVRHPLADHDHRNFRPEGLDRRGRPWGFDPATLAAARAHRATPQTPPGFLTQDLPLPDDDVIELDELIAFLEHPVKAFCLQQLDVRFPSEQDPLSDRIPSTLDGLEAWQVGEELLRAWRTGGDLDRAVQLQQSRGLVPPGGLATDDLAEVRERTTRIIELCEHRGVEVDDRYRTVDVRVELPDGRVLDGVVPDVAGWRLESLSYSRVKPKSRLRTWARFLALTVHDPEAPWLAITAGRHERRSNKARTVELPRLPGPADEVRAAATSHLQRLVDLYDRGRRAPLPLYCETSHKIADNLHGERAAEMYVGGDAWETGPYTPFAREDLDPYHVAVLGGQVPCADLFTERCRDEIEATWCRDDDRRVVAYAWRLWEPVLGHERRCER